MIEETSFERLEVALRRSIDDGAVVAFAAFPDLLSALSEDLRPSVSQAFDQYRPFDPGAVFFVAYLRSHVEPDGLWGTCRSNGQLNGYGLIIASDEKRYQSIRRMHAGLSTQEERP